MVMIPISVSELLLLPVASSQEAGNCPPEIFFAWRRIFLEKTSTGTKYSGNLPGLLRAKLYQSACNCQSGE